MELRKDGQLARTLDKMRETVPQALCGRPSRRRCRRSPCLPPCCDWPPVLGGRPKLGMVSLMSGGKVSYKRLDALTQEDRPARVAANRARSTWLKERRDG